MKKIVYSELAKARILEHGELCLDVAKREMEAAKLNFDDIEAITGIHKKHKWGSDTDRKYRQASVNKAIRIVAANPLKYGVLP